MVSSGSAMGTSSLAPLAELPVREIVSVTHTVSDMTLLAGEVVHDYLA